MLGIRLAGQLPELNHPFWKIYKGSVMYVSGKKILDVPQDLEMAGSSVITLQVRRGNGWRKKYTFDDEDGGEVDSYKAK